MSAQFADEVVRVLLGPFGQDYIVDGQLVLGEAIVVVVFVDEQFRQCVELGDQLPQICLGSCCVIPGAKVAVVESVCDIEFATLEGDCA